MDVHLPILARRPQGIPEHWPRELHLASEERYSQRRVGEAGVTRFTRPATQAVFGSACLAAGVVLYLAAVAINLDRYDESRATPWWLDSMAVLAMLLALVGILALVLAAIRAAWSRAPSGG
jgi:hypothetical protein